MCVSSQMFFLWRRLNSSKRFPCFRRALRLFLLETSFFFLVLCRFFSLCGRRSTFVNSWKVCVGKWFLFVSKLYILNEPHQLIGHVSEPAWEALCVVAHGSPPHVFRQSCEQMTAGGFLSHCFDHCFHLCCSGPCK